VIGVALVACAITAGSGMPATVLLVAVWGGIAVLAARTCR